MNTTFNNPTANQGLNDLVEVIDFVFAAKDALTAAKADDGKISLRDFPVILGLFAPADAAYAGIENIPSVWANTTEEERDAVLQYFKDKFDLLDDKVEYKIEKALEGVLAFYEAVAA